MAYVTGLDDDQLRERMRNNVVMCELHSQNGNGSVGLRKLAMASQVLCGIFDAERGHTMDIDSVSELAQLVWDDSGTSLEHASQTLLLKSIVNLAQPFINRQLRSPSVFEVPIDSTDHDPPPLLSPVVPLKTYKREPATMIAEEPPRHPIPWVIAEQSDILLDEPKRMKMSELRAPKVEETPHKCENCDRRFMSQRSIGQHSRFCKGMSVTEVSKNTPETARVSQMKRRNSPVSKSLPPPSTKVSTPANRRSSMQKRLENAPPNETMLAFGLSSRNVKCPLCKDELTTSTINKHLQMVHPDERSAIFGCPKCNLWYSSTSMCVRHHKATGCILIIRDNDDNDAEKGKDEESIERKELIEEVAEERAPTPIMMAFGLTSRLMKCPYCKEDYSNAMLAKHLYRDHHNELSSVFGCDKCDRWYTTPTSAVSHHKDKGCALIVRDMETQKIEGKKEKMDMHQESKDMTPHDDSLIEKDDVDMKRRKSLLLQKSWEKRRGGEPSAFMKMFGVSDYFVCPYCNDELACSSLDGHIRQAHFNEREAIFGCRSCDKWYATVSGATSHYRQKGCKMTIRSVKELETLNELDVEKTMNGRKRKAAAISGNVLEGKGEEMEQEITTEEETHITQMPMPNMTSPSNETMACAAEKMDTVATLEPTIEEMATVAAIMPITECTQ